MGKIAFLFPGQGAQYPGMGKALAACSPAAAEVFRKADALRPGTSAQCFSGTEAELQETKTTQPCLFAVELAAAAALADQMAEGALPMYTGHNNVRFKSPVKPGDLFETKCRITRSKPPFYFAEGSGYVGERLCLKAEFSFAIVKE